MKIINSFEELQQLKNIPCAVALGTFDGLHLGHQEVINTALDFEKTNELKSMVFTFSNHPMESIMPELVPPRIIDNATKEAILAKMGVDILVNIPFTHQIAEMSAERFLALLQQIGAQVAVVGENYSFGAKGAGTAETLETEGASFGLQVVVCKLLTLKGGVVSSTQIRKAIAEGDLEYASQMLGRPYSLKGVVVHGDARGRTIGFPTVNIELKDTKFVVPKSGVYAGAVTYRGKLYKVAANVGNNPTFGKNNIRLEAHIMDFNGDLYGKELTIELYKYLRSEQKFASVEDLKKQITKDEDEASVYLSKLEK